MSRNHSRVLTQPPVPPGRLDIGVEHVSDCERLAKQCQLWDLLEDLEAKCEKVSEFGVYRVSVQGLGLQPVALVKLSKSLLSSPLVASKPGTCVKVLTIEPPPADPRLREDLALLADCALPPELRVLKGMLAWWAGRVSRNGAGFSS